jgi:hypothetical protein
LPGKARSQNTQVDHAQVAEFARRYRLGLPQRGMGAATVGMFYFMAIGA